MLSTNRLRICIKRFDALIVTNKRKHEAETGADSPQSSIQACAMLLEGRNFDRRAKIGRYSHRMSNLFVCERVQIQSRRVVCFGLHEVSLGPQSVGSDHKISIASDLGEPSNPCAFEVSYQQFQIFGEMISFLLDFRGYTYILSYFSVYLFTNNNVKCYFEKQVYELGRARVENSGPLRPLLTIDNYVY